ncbi:MAG: DUF4062 domain-containing protein [Ruminococcaceae bacterium]|nr:DUF4062 domain-containing protein [Oscillospiraceae bacterium]
MIRIFVSSTFQDMHEERDGIQCITLPLVKQAAYRYGQTVSFVDLRWGIDLTGGNLSPREGTEKVLRRCLEAVENCAPPLVAMLGDRYGWIPGEEETDRDTVQRLAEEKGLTVDPATASVTAMEIAYGRQRSRQTSTPNLVYLRRVEGQTVESGDHPALLRSLKEQLQQDQAARVQEYTVVLQEDGTYPVEDFARRLAEDLINALTPTWEVMKVMPPFERSVLMHRGRLAEEQDGFRGREAITHRLLSRLDSGVRALSLQGPSGCGKTALCGHLTACLEQRGWSTLPLLSGYTPDTATALDIVKHIVWHLEHRLEDTGFFSAHLEGRFDAVISREQWHSRLNELCRQFAHTDQRLVILVDAVDSLFPDGDRASLLFLPEELGDNLRMVITATPSLQLGECEGHFMDLPTRADVVSMIEGMLFRDMKELPPTTVQALADKAMEQEPAAAPLYVTLALQRLYFMTKRELAGEAAIVAGYQQTLIEGLPGDVADLAVALLRYAIQRFKAPFLWEMLCFLATSENGLRDTHLLGACGLKDTDAAQVHTLQRFLYFLGDCFTQGDDGRYRFSHARIRRAVADTLSLTEWRAYNRQLARYLSRLSREDVCFNESVLLYMQANDSHGFASAVRACHLASGVDNRRLAAGHIVRACLRDGGDWLIKCTSLPDGTVSRLASFFAGMCLPLFEPTAPQQRVLFRVLQAYYERLCHSTAPDHQLMARLCLHLVEAADLAFDAQRARPMGAYYGHAAAYYAAALHAARPMRRHQLQQRRGRVAYAGHLSKGMLRQQMLVLAFKEDPESPLAVQAARYLLEDEKVSLTRVVGLQKKMYESSGSQEDLLILLDIYKEYYERQIAKKMPLSYTDRGLLEEMRRLVETTGKRLLSQSQRLWLEAAVGCAASGEFLPSVPQPEDLVTAHAYTAAAMRRHRFARTERTLEALQGAIDREYVALSAGQEITYSLALLVTAMDNDWLQPEEPPATEADPLLQREAEGRVWRQRLWWVRSRAPLLMRIARLARSAAGGTWRQKRLLTQERVLLHRLGGTRDLSLMDDLLALLEGCENPRQRQEVLDDLTALITMAIDRLPIAMMVWSYEEMKQAAAPLWPIFCRLWGADIAAGELPAEQPVETQVAFARWALLAASAITHQQEVCRDPEEDALWACRRRRLCRYARTVADALAGYAPVRGEVQRLQLALTEQPDKVYTPEEALAVCVAVSREGETPADRLEGHVHLIDLLLDGLEERSDREREQGARSAMTAFYMTGDYRYYQKAERFSADYVKSHIRPELPEPKATPPVTREELEVGYARAKQARAAYATGYSFISPNLVGDEAELRGVSIVLGPADVVDSEEATWEATVTELTLPDLVCGIRKGAFARAGLLRRLTVPTSVTTLEPGAFVGCDRLEQLVLPACFADRDHAWLGLSSTVTITYT